MGNKDAHSRIDTIDADDVALAAIQGLNQQVEAVIADDALFEAQITGFGFSGVGLLAALPLVIGLSNGLLIKQRRDKVFAAS